MESSDYRDSKKDKKKQKKKSRSSYRDVDDSGRRSSSYVKSPKSPNIGRSKTIHIDELRRKKPKLHKKSSSSAGSSIDKSKKKEKLTRGKTYDGGRRKSKEYNTRKSRVTKSPKPKPKPRSKNNQGS